MHIQLAWQLRQTLPRDPSVKGMTIFACLCCRSDAAAIKRQPGTDAGNAGTKDAYPIRGLRATCNSKAASGHLQQQVLGSRRPARCNLRLGLPQRHKPFWPMYHQGPLAAAAVWQPWHLQLLRERGNGRPEDQLFEATTAGGLAIMHHACPALIAAK
jgi:hypothetical protein